MLWVQLTRIVQSADQTRLLKMENSMVEWDTSVKHATNNFNQAYKKPEFKTQ